MRQPEHPRLAAERTLALFPSIHLRRPRATRSPPPSTIASPC